MNKILFKTVSIIAMTSLAVSSMFSLPVSATEVAHQSVPYGSYTRYYTTFTGSYNYIQEVAVVYHIDLTLSSSPAVTVKYQKETVTLKDGIGNNKPTITATANYADHVSTSTPTFSGTTYTHKGYYAYKVDSSNHAYGSSNVSWSKTVV